MAETSKRGRMLKAKTKATAKSAAKANGGVAKKKSVPASVAKPRPSILGSERWHSYEWVDQLVKHPEYAEHCDWGKLSGNDWQRLLREQPKFAEHCDWNKLDGFDWQALLREQPKFADKCDWDKWNDLEGADWASWLAGHPEDADKCDWYLLEVYDWVSLLLEQPQFATLCTCWDEMDDEDVTRLMQKRPELKSHIAKADRTKFTEREKVVAIRKPGGKAKVYNVRVTDLKDMKGLVFETYKFQVRGYEVVYGHKEFDDLDAFKAWYSERLDDCEDDPCEAIDMRKKVWNNLTAYLCKGNDILSEIDGCGREEVECDVSGKCLCYVKREESNKGVLGAMRVLLPRGMVNADKWIMPSGREWTMDGLTGAGSVLVDLKAMLDAEPSLAGYSFEDFSRFYGSVWDFDEDVSGACDVEELDDNVLNFVFLGSDYETRGKSIDYGIYTRNSPGEEFKEKSFDDVVEKLRENAEKKAASKKTCVSKKTRKKVRCLRGKTIVLYPMGEDLAELVERHRDAFYPDDDNDPDTWDAEQDIASFIEQLEIEDLEEVQDYEADGLYIDVDDTSCYQLAKDRRTLLAFDKT
ncbi:MAG: hypothetical protein WCJ02_07770 [bacterium]